MGRCPTTALAFEPKAADPQVEVPVKLITEWITYWLAHPQQRLKLSRAWVSIKARMAQRQPQTRWRFVKGHISAVIVTIMELLEPEAHRDSTASRLGDVTQTITIIVIEALVP